MKRYPDHEASGSGPQAPGGVGLPASDSRPRAIPPEAFGLSPLKPVARSLEPA
jgi:hypothetical protein